ncbi:MAG: glycosyltransferase family 9 protein [Lentimicrobiaceae bacterium]|nr:glycosyltransferase family 9 protein [Lentimicrobiaceae bacterium]
MPKILVIRFSSIGDIVLTTPVVRCLKMQIPGAEVHYLTKRQYLPLLEANPYLDAIHVIGKNVTEVVPALKAENFDFIVDLHKNLRSFIVLLQLRKPFGSFSKLNLRKFLYTKFKINLLPNVHIVDRYFAAVRKLGVTNDGKGLDYSLPQDKEINLYALPPIHQNGFVAFAIGAKQVTKALPAEKIIAVCQKLEQPVILLGGKEDFEKGEKIREALGNKVVNACGMYSLHGSASLVKQARIMITHDTGLMHIAAAFDKKIVSIWGNTVPQFGMYPYLPQNPGNAVIIEVKNLKCRPCSKLGYARCPKKHFDCMMKIDENAVAEQVKNKSWD